MGTPAKTVLAIALVAAAFGGGSWYRDRTETTRAAQRSPQILYYACPMHPQYHSDRPGDCPSCGMRLEPVSGGQTAPSAPPAIIDSGVEAVRVSPEKQQMIGVRTAEVKKVSDAQLLRVSGRIAVDDGRLYRINAGADGWIRELGQNSPGVFVKKGQILASYYTPNLVASTQTLVFAMQTNAQAASGDATIGYQRGTTTLSLQVALDSLRSLGMSEKQIEEIRETRVAPDKINVYSPVDGFVIARNISPEQRFDKGSEMYRIADISHVWVMSDIFEKDREFVKPGVMATVRYRGREYPASMSAALPQFDQQSRTLKARFEVDNPGYVLQPDMFVDVELRVNMPAAVSVPADAVVDSGLKKVVYVAKSSGYFEPRVVETGWRYGDKVEIVNGLVPGEQIVVAGTFMLDSESRMRMPAHTHSDIKAEISRAQPTLVDPVCGMDVDPAKAAGKREYKGKTYYFCSDHCVKKFDGHPEEYAGNAGN